MSSCMAGGGRLWPVRSRSACVVLVSGAGAAPSRRPRVAPDFCPLSRAPLRSTLFVWTVEQADGPTISKHILWSRVIRLDAWAVLKYNAPARRHLAGRGLPTHFKARLLCYWRPLWPTEQSELEMHTVAAIFVQNVVAVKVAVRTASRTVLLRHDRRQWTCRTQKMTAVFR